MQPDQRTATELAEHFPGSNPHPVMRVSGDGRLTYANQSAGPLLEAMAIRVGDSLPDDWGRRITEAASSALPIELKVGPLTYEILVVELPGLGFLNLYGTDVTAERAVVKFPDQNPNPVFRLNWDGHLVYANPASRQLVDSQGWLLDESLPAPILDQLLLCAKNERRETVEVVGGDRRYRLLPVDVPEFNFINVYGTDVTAAHALEEAYRENERLLLNVLPEPVAERLRRGERPIADRFADVSLLFADIVGFTSLSGDMAADQLVTVLNDVFSVFDQLVDEAGLEKVKTIGDAYMVVGGMTTDMDDHLARLARMALGLWPALQNVGACRSHKIQFRIGIHSGPVVAGVIGTRKFIYDVWGDTVNVASRMESTGIPGRVQVTASVEERLREQFVFEPRGLTEIRGKGPMATYFLVSERTATPDPAGAPSAIAQR